MSFFSHVPSSARSCHSTYVDRSSIDETVLSNSLLSNSRKLNNNNNYSNNNNNNNNANYNTSMPHDGQMPLYLVNSPLNVSNNSNYNNFSDKNNYQKHDPRNGRLSLSHSLPSRRGRPRRATLYLRTPMPTESERLSNRRNDVMPPVPLSMEQLSPPPHALTTPLLLQTPTALNDSQSLLGSEQHAEEERSVKHVILLAVEWVTHTVTSLPEKARNNRVREMLVVATVFLFLLLLQLYLVMRTERTIGFLLSVRMNVNEQLVMVSSSLTAQLLAKAAMIEEMQQSLSHVTPSHLEHVMEELQSLRTVRDQSIHTLYNKTEYLGPESDLAFLIDEHVGYENRVRVLAAEEIDWLDTSLEAQQHEQSTHTQETDSTLTRSNSFTWHNYSTRFAKDMLNLWRNRDTKPVVSKRDEYLQQTVNRALSLQKVKVRFNNLEDDWAVGGSSVEVINKSPPTQATKLEHNTLAVATEEEAAQMLVTSQSISLWQMLRSRLILIPVIIILVYTFLQIT